MTAIGIDQNDDGQGTVWYTLRDPDYIYGGAVLTEIDAKKLATINRALKAYEKAQKELAELFSVAERRDLEEKQAARERQLAYHATEKSRQVEARRIALRSIYEQAHNQD